MTQQPNKAADTPLNLIRDHKLRLLGLSLLTALILNGCDQAPNAPSTEASTDSPATTTTTTDTEKAQQEQYLSKEQKAFNKFAKEHQKEINAIGAMPFNEFYTASKICLRPQYPSTKCRAIYLISEERFNTEIKRLDQDHPGEQLKIHTDTVCTAIPAQNIACDMSNRALNARQHP